MNVLIVTNSLCYGGAESFSLQFFERLKKENINVKYAVFSTESSLLNRFKSIQPNEIKCFIPHVKTNIFKILSKIFTVKRYLKENEIKTVYCCQPQSALVFWLINIFLYKINVIYITMHVYQNADFKERLIWKTIIPNKGTKFFVGLSEYLAQELISKNKVDSKKTVINRLPVDTSKFVPLPKSLRINYNLPVEKTIIGVCCRLESIKRVHLFVEAFKYIKDDSVIGVIYGDGPEKKNIEALITKGGLSGKIQLNGFIENAHEVIPMFDVYLQTGSGPNLGLVTLEAFSCGVPVIMLAENAVEQYMINDTFCNQNVGRIATPCPENIAKTILEIIKENKTKEMSDNARKLALEHYSWGKFLKNNNDLLNKCI